MEKRIFALYKPVKKKFEISKLLEGIPSQDEISKMSGKLDEVLANLVDLKRDHKEIIENQEEIKIRLNSHYDYLINLPDNNKIKDDILDAINEINAQQTTEISEDIMQCIGTALERSEGKLDDKSQEIYSDLKKTDDFQMKLKLAVPFINMLGVNLEAEFDVKSWATKMYKKHELKIFKLMGYL